MSNPLLTHFQIVLQKEHLVEKGDSLVVGVSGGRDSVCLLHLFASIQPQWGLRMVVAHLNHCLRGEASEEDERFVTLLSKRLGIACVVERNRFSRLRRGGDSLELTARRERYQFFQRVCQSVGATKVALAHTRDDDAETILFRILRGNCGKGLQGIPFCRKLGSIQVIRPLKEIGREAIRQFLLARGLSWREDASNADLHFTRNRIRKELLPYLEEQFNPRIQEALLRLGRERSELEEYLSSEIERVARRYLRRRPSGDLLLQGDGVLRLHPFLQKGLFWRCLEELGLGGGAFKSTHADLVPSLLRRGKGRADLPQSLQVEVDQEGLHVSRQPGIIRKEKEIMR